MKAIPVFIALGLLGAAVVTQVVTAPGDLDGDGDVDLRDYATMQNNFSGPIPLWLQDHITYYEGRPAGNRPRSIARYCYREQVVYYRPPYCCDIPGIVWDASGAFICSPGGGWGGVGDCPEFADERTDELIVWSDS